MPSTVQPRRIMDPRMDNGFQVAQEASSHGQVDPKLDYFSSIKHKAGGGFSPARLLQVGLSWNTAFIWGHPPFRTDKKTSEEVQRDMRGKKKKKEKG